jgi:hypothetical protein
MTKFTKLQNMQINTYNTIIIDIYILIPSNTLQMPLFIARLVSLLEVT